MKSVAQHEVGVAGSPRVRSLGVGGHVKVPGLLPLLSEEELVRELFAPQPLQTHLTVSPSGV